jgi:signal transduction histidine kinase
VALIGDLRASRMRLVAAQDEERRRLERDLHDGAQQQFVALSIQLGLAESMARRAPERTAEMLAGLQTQATEALDQLRDLAHGIYPPLLADQGLVVALEAQARKGAVPTTVEADGLGRYSKEVEAAAYFCCLESLQNVAKYARATGAAVKLEATDGFLAFSVTDDGVGFRVATTPRGAGTTNMADRLDALGGVLEVRSSPGRGTTVFGRIPIGVAD